jgi:RNA polymerase sigma-70 factor (ECF subfamily)
MAWRIYDSAARPGDSSERELVEAAMAGDADAFSSLAEASARRLYAVARLILHNDALAEDATQEALVVAWRDLSALRDPARFEAWLHRVLVRECYKHGQRERRRVQVEGQVQSLTVETDPSHQSIVSDQIERGFSRLSVEHRTVLVLHHYLGYTFPEIAATMGVPVGTVKSRVSRACAAMREALTTELDVAPLRGGQVA